MMLQDVFAPFFSSLMNKDKDDDTKISYNTMLAYRTDLSLFVNFLAAQNVTYWSAVTCEHIEAYLVEMQEEQSYRPTTVARKLAVLRVFFLYLYEQKCIVENPLEQLARPTIKRDLPQTLSSEQVQGLFNCVPQNTPAGLRDLAMLHVLYSTGIRTSELVDLDLKHFDVDCGIIICVAKPETMKFDRLLPLSYPAFEVLNCYVEQARPRLIRYPREQALFLNQRGERLSRQGFWLIVKGYAQRSDIPDLSASTLRNSFTVMMLKDGMEPEKVRGLLGHSTIAPTRLCRQLLQSTPLNQQSFS